MLFVLLCLGLTVIDSCWLDGRFSAQIQKELRFSGRARKSCSTRQLYELPCRSDLCI
jgi:hypothetical protein